MKKIIVVLILLLVLFSFLFAEEIEKKETNIWKKIVKAFLWVMGIIIFILFIGIVYFIIYVFLYGDRSDSGKIRIKTGEKLNLKLKEFLGTEKDELSFGFIVKSVLPNKITLQCKICKEGKIIFTKTFGVDTTKKVTKRIKNIFNYPIDISTKVNDSGEEILIEAETIMPEPITLPENFSENIF
jgi:hypothetical protein